jgi:hypothetical protein
MDLRIDLDNCFYNYCLGGVHFKRLAPDNFWPENEQTGSAHPSGYTGVSVHCQIIPAILPGLISGFCSSGPGFASGFLQTLPHGNALAFS